MKSIVFVCTGNICRSPMAEYMLRHMLGKAGIEGIEVFSRGVSAMERSPMSEYSIAELEDLGIDGSPHRAASLTTEDVERADLLLVMTRSHWAAVLGEWPEASDKVFLLKDYAGIPPGEPNEIADPYGESREAYHRCRIDIEDSLLGVLNKIKTL